MQEQIDQFFAPDGTLISIPVKAAKKIAVLKEIAKKLSPNTKYPEKELNAVIASAIFHLGKGCCSNGAKGAQCIVFNHLGQCV